MIGRAVLVPNPNEFYPSVDEFMGRLSTNGSLARTRGELLSAVRPESGESAMVPSMYVGNFPVTSADRDIITWGNACH